MPLLNNQDMDRQMLPNGHYGYSGAKIDDLGATEYTLVTIAVDVSSSVSVYKDQLESALQQIIQSCRMSPRADNLLVRLTAFHDKIDELHGYKLLQNCHLGDYAKILKPNGCTALYDATENAVTATADYGQRLFDADFSVNGIVFVLTDGMDNASHSTVNSIRSALSKVVRSEILESMLTILIGVNVFDADVSKHLDDFHQAVGFTQYIEIAKADANTLANLASFVARSISMQSQALGSGTPSASLRF